MAFKHRKLFPIQTVTNQTIDCPLFCDPSCPYECYPYSGFYFPPPIPSPPPIDPSDKKISLSPSMIIIVTLLASFFLIVSYYAIIVKCCSNCNRSRNRSQHPQSDGAEEDDQERLDENLGPVIDNPIWFITTVGLQQAIINSITVCKYKKGEGLIEGTECSVCLSEFKEEETLRLLPKCNHAFHIHCIDTWLRSHTNCPLCRARIVTDTVTAISDHNSQNFSGNEDTQIGNYEGEFELDENQARNNGFSAENRAGTEDGSELQQGNFEDTTSKKAVHSDGNIDNCPQILGKTVDNHKDIEVGARPLGRSISMGSSSTGSIRLSLSTFDSADSEGSSLERSFSCSGISFLPRHDGRCSDSVLPL